MFAGLSPLVVQEVLDEGAWIRVRRRSDEPAVSVHRLFEEIKTLGYQGSLNLLYRYITRAASRATSPRSRPGR